MHICARIIIIIIIIRLNLVRDTTKNTQKPCEYICFKYFYDNYSAICQFFAKVVFKGIVCKLQKELQVGTVKMLLIDSSRSQLPESLPKLPLTPKTRTA